MNRPHCAALTVAATLGLAACALAGERAASAARAETFALRLSEARDAQARGEAKAARAKLLEAARLLEGDRFHELVIEATGAYDRGAHARARGRLKKATQWINPWFWVILGFLGQAFFTSRFIVQWLASERRKKSVVPTAFWHLSLGGSALLLTYAIWRQDPVIILGQCFNSIVYVRNLTFIYRERLRAATAPGEGRAS